MTEWPLLTCGNVAWAVAGYALGTLGNTGSQPLAVRPDGRRDVVEADSGAVDECLSRLEPSADRLPGIGMGGVPMGFVKPRVVIGSRRGCRCGHGVEYVDAAARQALRFLRESGEVMEIGTELVLSADALEKMRRSVIATIRRTGGATVSDLRQSLGSSRRVVVPLLEYFDKLGVTRRVGIARLQHLARVAVDDDGGGRWVVGADGCSFVVTPAAGARVGVAGHRGDRDQHGQPKRAPANQGLDMAFAPRHQTSNPIEKHDDPKSPSWPIYSAVCAPEDSTLGKLGYQNPNLCL